MATSRGLLPSPPRLIADLVRAIGAIAVEPVGGQQEPSPSPSPSPSSSPSAAAAAAAAAAASSSSSAVLGNPLERVPLDQRPLLATLHVLFPAVLLPALDLLDQRRVVRYCPAAIPGTAGLPLYQVLGDTPHVVRLCAWHCTCAYFALREASEGDADDQDGQDGQSREMEDDIAHFSTPPCRHLLACLLAERWPALRAHALAVDDCRPEVLAGVAAGVD